MAAKNHESGVGDKYNTNLSYAELIKKRSDERLGRIARQQAWKEKAAEYGVNHVSTDEWLKSPEKPIRHRSILPQPSALGEQGLLKGSERQDR